ncbi:MAG TPA: G/U mismatch-specific DNA glycosylase [Alphaproteobacteria bacterium]|nr:G/U mismatch-specific DNA glycosylase [Alphaproteobacteria bacterium]
MPKLLPDILAPNLHVIFCGINPGFSAAEAGHHFLNRSNRFWRVLHLSGLTPHQIEPENDRSILQYGYGLTTAVARPTRRAAELSRGEFEPARTALEGKVRHMRPYAIAFLGKRAYAEMTAEKSIRWGLQSTPFAETQAWVMPNPSGLNRGFSLDALVAAFREMRVMIESEIRSDQVLTATRPTNA